MKKIDFLIGNPAYQDETVNNNRKPPVYHFLWMRHTKSHHVLN